MMKRPIHASACDHRPSAHNDMFYIVKHMSISNFNIPQKTASARIRIACRLRMRRNRLGNRKLEFENYKMRYETGGGLDLWHISCSIRKAPAAAVENIIANISVGLAAEQRIYIFHPMSIPVDPARLHFDAIPSRRYCETTLVPVDSPPLRIPHNPNTPSAWSVDTTSTEDVVRKGHHRHICVYPQYIETWKYAQYHSHESIVWKIRAGGFHPTLTCHTPHKRYIVKNFGAFRLLLWKSSNTISLLGRE